MKILVASSKNEKYSSSKAFIGSHASAPKSAMRQEQGLLTAQLIASAEQADGAAVNLKESQNIKSEVVSFRPAPPYSCECDPSFGNQRKFKYR